MNYKNKTDNELMDEYMEYHNVCKGEGCNPTAYDMKTLLAIEEELEAREYKRFDVPTWFKM